MGRRVRALTSGTTLDDVPPASLHHAGHDGLSIGSPSTLSWATPSNVGFVNLDFSEEGNAFLGHELADLGEHPPGRLVSDAYLPFELLGRYAGPGRGHQEHCVEPGPERGGGLVEDGVGSRGDLGATELAAVDLPARDPEVLGDPVALGASDTMGPSSVLEEVQAGVIVGKLLVERFNRVLFYTPIVAEKVRVVKG